SGSMPVLVEGYPCRKPPPRRVSATFARQESPAGYGSAPCRGRLRRLQRGVVREQRLQGCGMVRHLDDSDVAANIRLSTAVMDVIGAALAAPSDRSSALPPESRSTTLLLSIKAFIERELPNPALTPSGIAAEHHISF